MKIVMNSLFLKILLISVIAFHSDLVFGAGVAALKEQTFHDDKSAKIIFYTLLRNDGRTVQITSENKILAIEARKLVENVEILSVLPENIITENDLKPIRISADKCRNFVNRFPKSSSILTSQIQSLDACIRGFENGKVRYEGKWMPKDEAQAMIQNKEKEKKEAEIEAERKSREKIEFIESQKAKGLVKYNDTWITKEEAKLIEEKRIAFLKRQAEIERERIKEEEEYELNGLVLLKKTVSAMDDVIGSTISGTVVNQTGRELDYVTIEYKLYDASGAQVGTASASINNLEAGARWNFKAHAFVDFRKYKLSKMQGL